MAEQEGPMSHYLSVVIGEDRRSGEQGMAYAPRM